MSISAFLVEDQPEIQQTLIEAMEELAPVTFVGLASDEAAATKWLGSNNHLWDLAIIDLFLKKGTGLGVLKECRARAPRQKVVVLTSCTEQGVIQRCRDLGADEVFDKAQDIEKLVAFCRTHAINVDSMADFGLITVAPVPPAPSLMPR